MYNNKSRMVLAGNWIEFILNDDEKYYYNSIDVVNSVGSETDRFTLEYISQEQMIAFWKKHALKGNKKAQSILGEIETILPGIV